MEFFQWARNPWGQEVLERISWDLLWASIVAGVLFVVVHLLLRRRWAAKAEAGEEVAGEKVMRHGIASRLFHWVMAATMFVLLLTGFLPVVGIKFPWVMAHWISGIVLIGCILFHIIHATFWQSLRNIWISPRDVKIWWREMTHSLGTAKPPADKPGKYPMDHKLYHHVVSLASLGVIVTGLLMMFRVDTPLFARNPYLLQESTWGLVYVIHGLSSVLLVALTITHVYFAVLPEKRWITKSMIFGWITRRKYLENHDPDQWVASEAAEAGETSD